MLAADRPLLPLLAPRESTTDEARRQLSICNSCRYCEGLCAVFPALERRGSLLDSDVSHLANLCHDCRACYTACMYVPPHEFAVNLPRALTKVRLEDYRRFVWPRRPPGRPNRRWGLGIGLLAAFVVLLAVSGLTEGWRHLVTAPAGGGSPYEVISYPALLLLFGGASAFSVAVMTVAAIRYARAEPAPTRSPRELLRAVVTGGWSGLALRNQRGGGGECFYPDDERPSAVRRRAHYALAGGFGLCMVSTMSAGVMQDLAGIEPPYPYVSVPVVSGMLGGIGMVVGGAILLVLKRSASAVTGTAEMTGRDNALITALLLLAATGMLCTLTRGTPAYGLLLVAHLSLIVVSTVIWPYTKFSHFVYRLIALVRHEGR